MTFKTPAGPFQALAPVTLAIAEGRFVSLIGPVGLRQEHDLQYRCRSVATDRRPAS